MADTADTADTGRSRVLFITEFLPWPLTNGGAIRAFHVLRQLCRFHDVTVVTQVGPDQEPGVDEVRGFPARVRSVPRRVSGRGAKALRALAALASPKPFVSAWSHWSPELAAALEDELARGSWDVVHCDHLDAAIYVASLFDDVPVFLDDHNFEAELLRSARDKTSSRLLRWYLSSQLPKLERFESEVVRGCAGVSVVSAEDGRAIARRFQVSEPHLVPNGVDLERFDFERTPEDWNVVTVGSLDWVPNVEGLLWFLDEVWPLIVDREPRARFHIVGRNPPARLLARRSDTVDVHGNVPDVRDWVARGSVFVVPLLAGGGTRLKVLEAMASRIPLVATSKAVEGIDCEPENHYLRADDADGFAGAVLRLFTDRELRGELSRRARGLMEDRYGWDAVGDALASAYADLPCSRGQRSAVS